MSARDIHTYLSLEKEEAEAWMMESIPQVHTPQLDQSFPRSSAPCAFAAGYHQCHNTGFQVHGRGIAVIDRHLNACPGLDYGEQEMPGQSMGPPGRLRVGESTPPPHENDPIEDADVSNPRLEVLPGFTMTAQQGDLDVLLDEPLINIRGERAATDRGRRKELDFLVEFRGLQFGRVWEKQQRVMKSVHGPAAIQDFRQDRQPQQSPELDAKQPKTQEEWPARELIYSEISRVGFAVFQFFHSSTRALHSVLFAFTGYALDHGKKWQCRAPQAEPRDCWRCWASP